MQVMQGFIAHWDSVNSAISPDVLTLSGGFTLANFTTARTEIESAMTAIEVADNTRDAAGSVRDQGKSGLLIRFSQVRAAVLTLFPGTIYRRMLPRQPGFSSVESRFLKPFDDAANIWSQINTDSIPGFTPPLKLAGGYTLANFQADIAALRAAYIALTNAESLARQRRSERDALLPPAKEQARAGQSAPYDRADALPVARIDARGDHCDRRLEPGDAHGRPELESIDESASFSLLFALFSWPGLPHEQRIRGRRDLEDGK